MEIEAGNRVAARSGTLKEFYHWPEIPEYFTVVKTHANPSGAISLLVEDPNRERGSFMSRSWWNAAKFRKV